MTSSAQLERDAERCRAELAGTIQELRAFMRPGRMVDEAIDYASASTGGQFASNLKDQVAANPIPVALMSAGLLWLMMGRRTTDGAAASSSTSAGALTRGMHDAASTAAGIGASVADSANSAGTRIAETASGIGESMSSAARKAGEAASATGAALSGSANRAAAGVSDAATRARRAGEQAADTLREDPLLLAGLGLAVGALAGALLGHTRAEDRLMGEASDGVKESIGELAGGVKATINEAAGEAQEAIGEMSGGDAGSRPAAAQRSETDQLRKISKTSEQVIAQTQGDDSPGGEHPSIVPAQDESGEAAPRERERETGAGPSAPGF
ncbi:MAG TPA: DUF3618 domain-containing protein [Xanthobacteraceae bacterium]|nr:DUF3618 domain-containing protein [Xanthobacteraceae bacterium]